MYLGRNGPRNIPAGDVRSVLDDLRIDMLSNLPDQIDRLKPPEGSYVEAQSVRTRIDELSKWHRELGRQGARR